ncbi:MAG: GNAT family N-acetyltransferase [Actinomycetes bacterium]
MSAPTNVIQTKQLGLHLIPVAELFMLHEDPDNKLLLVDRDFTNPYKELTHEHSGPLRWRVPQVKADPATNIWFIRWIVLRATKEVVGSISFHAPPDEVGMIEIGFGICEPCRNKGYGKEALLGMWTWVIDQPGVQTLRYTVSASNGPSMAIINSLGFEHVGQQIDVEDGPEEIYEMSADEFRSRLVNGFSPNNGS